MGWNIYPMAQPMRGLCPGDKILSGEHSNLGGHNIECVTLWKMLSMEQLLQSHNSEGPRFGGAAEPACDPARPRRTESAIG